MPTVELDRLRNVGKWIEEPRNESDYAPTKEHGRRITAARTPKEQGELALCRKPRSEPYFLIKCSPENDLQQRIWSLFRFAHAKASREEADRTANIVAARLKVTHAQAYSEAIALIEKRENEKLTEELNEVYGGELEPEEREFRQRAKDYRRRRLSAE